MGHLNNNRDKDPLNHLKHHLCIICYLTELERSERDLNLFLFIYLFPLEPNTTLHEGGVKEGQCGINASDSVKPREEQRSEVAGTCCLCCCVDLQRRSLRRAEPGVFTGPVVV